MQGKEDILLYTSFEQLFEAQVLFITKAGFIKLVSGIEFDTNRSQINTTKLEDDDLIVGLTLLSGADILAENQKVIIYTTNGLSLGFSLTEVPELKKVSRGVKAITLDEKDCVVYGACVPSDTETFTYRGKQYSVKKIRNRKRGEKGQKATLS